MSTFECTWQQLKQVAADYIRAIPDASLEELEAGLKCFHLHYLGCCYKNELEEHQGALLFNIVGKQYLKAELERM